MRYLFVLTIASIALSTSGCVSQTTSPSETTTSEGQQSSAPSGTSAARNSEALVRFVNADPEGKGRDVWAQDGVAFNRVGYKMITPYLPMPTGVRKFHLRESGETKDLAVGQQELFFGRHYTMVALPNPDHSSSMVIMNDSLSELESGRARVRLINATPNLDDVDLYIAGTKTRIQHGVDASKATSFTDVDGGTLEIRVKDGHAPPQFSNLKVEVDRLYTFIVGSQRLRLPFLNWVES